MIVVVIQMAVAVRGGNGKATASMGTAIHRARVSVVANFIVVLVIASTSFRVTKILGTNDVIIAHDGRTRNASPGVMTGVVLIARLNSVAKVVVGAAGRRFRVAAVVGVAGLNPIAELSVVALNGRNERDAASIHLAGFLPVVVNATVAIRLVISTNQRLVLASTRYGIAVIDCAEIWVLAIRARQGEAPPNLIAPLEPVALVSVVGGAWRSRAAVGEEFLAGRLEPITGIAVVAILRLPRDAALPWYARFSTVTEHGVAAVIGRA